jgi:hypothetical protein
MNTGNDRSLSEATEERSRMAQRLRRILERLTGPSLSLLFHIAVVAFLLMFYVGPGARTLDRSIEVAVIDPSANQLPLDKMKPDQDQELTPDEEFTDMTIPAPDSDDLLDALDTDSMLGAKHMDRSLELSPIYGATLLIDTSVSDGQLQRKASSSFGFDKSLEGDLIGTMYDLKRDRRKRDRSVDYYSDLRRMVEGRFSEKVMKAYYRVPKQLYLSYLFLPYMNADAGPAAFGVGELMEPTKWIVHYAGRIQAPLGGRYRFVGEFDDVLLVFIDGRVVLESTWGDHVTSWRPSEHVGAHRSYTTRPLVYGDWVTLKALAPHRIDIIIGEDPGGKVGGLLLLQQEGGNYARESSGRPVLPVFAAQPLTPDDRAALTRVSGWKVETDHVPIMGFRHEMHASKKPDPDEVSIIIE